MASAFHRMNSARQSKGRPLTDNKSVSSSMQRTRQVVECFHIARGRGWLGGRRPDQLARDINNKL